MEFLVRIAVRLPSDLPEAEEQQLRSAELAAGRALAAAGTIQRIWRVPGTTSNVGIWRADDADELHQALSSLPLWRWLEVEVQALAEHPVDMRHVD